MSLSIAPHGEMSASLDLVFSGVINVNVIRTAAKDLVLHLGLNSCLHLQLEPQQFFMAK